MSEGLLFENEASTSTARYGSLDDGKVKAIAQPADKHSNAVAFLDIDGVFADCDHRLPYYDNKEWEKFYGASMAADTIDIDYTTVAPILAGLVAMYRNVKWVFLTGRPERTRALCNLWIKQNLPFFANYDVENNMLMREDDDHRVGFKVKWDLMHRWLLQNDANQLANSDVFFIDDDYRNIRYCFKKIEDFGSDQINYLHGIVLGGGRLPSVHAVSSTSELGKN